MKAGFALQNSSISHFSLLHFFVPFNFGSVVFPSVFQLFTKPKNTSTWNATEQSITAKVSSVVTPEAPIPTELKVYDLENALMGTLVAVSGGEGRFSGQITAIAAWQQFYVMDEENNIAYGANAAGLSSGDDKYNRDCRLILPTSIV